MVGWFSHTDNSPTLDNAGMPIAPSSIATLADDSPSTNSRARGGQGSQPARSSSSHLYHDDISISNSSHTSPRATSGKTGAKTVDVDSSKAKENSTVPKPSEAAATPETP